MLGLPPGLRIATVTGWLADLDRHLAASRYAQVPVASELRQHGLDAAIMPALILNSIFGLTFSIYSVAPIAWLLIGWISAETLRMRETPTREIITI